MTLSIPFQYLFKACSGIVQNFFNTVSLIVKDFYRTCPGHVRDFFMTFSNILKSSCIWKGPLEGSIYRFHFKGPFKETFWKICMHVVASGGAAISTGQCSASEGPRLHFKTSLRLALRFHIASVWDGPTSNGQKMCWTSNLLIRLTKTCPKLNLVTLLTKLVVSTRFQPAIYTVLHDESESEVQNTQIMQENLEIWIFRILKILCDVKHMLLTY